MVWSDHSSDKSVLNPERPQTYRHNPFRRTASSRLFALIEETEPLEFNHSGLDQSRSVQHANPVRQMPQPVSRLGIQHALF